MTHLSAPLLLAGAFLASSCATAPKKNDPWNSYNVTFRPGDNTKYEFGKGLEGRMVDGKKVYTIQVDCIISPEGRVAYAHVHRADAPERLQWGVVRGVKQMQFPARKKAALLRHTFILKSLDVKPG